MALFAGLFLTGSICKQVVAMSLEDLAHLQNGKPRLCWSMRPQFSYARTRRDYAADACKVAATSTRKNPGKCSLRNRVLSLGNGVLPFHHAKWSRTQQHATNHSLLTHTHTRAHALVPGRVSTQTLTGDETRPWTAHHHRSHRSCLCAARLRHLWTRSHLRLSPDSVYANVALPQPPIEDTENPGTQTDVHSFSVKAAKQAGNILWIISDLAALHSQPGIRDIRLIDVHAPYHGADSLFGQEAVANRVLVLGLLGQIRRRLICSHISCPHAPPGPRFKRVCCWIGRPASSEETKPFTPLFQLP